MICGCIYTCKTNSKTCSIECRKIRYRQINSQDHKKAYARKKILDDVKECKPSTFEDDVREARRLGLSYGIYKARQQAAKGGRINVKPDQRCNKKQKI